MLSPGAATRMVALNSGAHGSITVPLCEASRDDDFPGIFFDSDGTDFSKIPFDVRSFLSRGPLTNALSIQLMPDLRPSNVTWFRDRIGATEAFEVR